jgi:hypothetical protein
MATRNMPYLVGNNAYDLKGILGRHKQPRVQEDVLASRYKGI